MGAIADHLRQRDYLGKSARERVKQVRGCVQEYQRRTGRKPDVEELCGLTDLSERAVLDSLNDERWDRVVSLAEQVEGEDGKATALIALISGDAEEPLAKLEWEEQVERLAGAIGELPERERQVIVMYYYEDLYMSEIAEILGVSESRISQLHTRALYDLSRKLEER